MYFIDVQGTLIDDKNRLPIDGAIEFIEELNQKNIPYILITNNTKHSSCEFLSYLNSIGFNVCNNRYLDPLQMLQEVVNVKRVAPFGSNEFIETVGKLGFLVDYDKPEAIFVGVKKDFNSEEFALMIEKILNGAILVGMHQTSLYAKDNKRYPGVGAILEMLKYATHRDYIVVGKPSSSFYNRALEKLENLAGKKINFKDVTIVSDDLKGDLVGAKELGIKTIFVLSGKIKDANEIIPYIPNEQIPDMIYNSIKDVKIV